MEYFKKNKINFCLPVYNEEKILEHNTLKLYHFLNKQNYTFNWCITILVNGSTDCSLNICKKLSNKINKISFINIKTPGRGNALKEYWEKSNYEIYFYMDIDLAVSLDDIDKLLKPILNDEAELCIGSRLLPESKIERSFIRELSSQSYNFLSRLILNHHFSDLQCGFKVIKKETFQKISPYIFDKHWFFDTELVYLTKKFGYQVKEMPVDWSENRYEKRKSKVNLLKDSIKFTINLLKLKQRTKNLNLK